jgi:hypothetical protein
VTSGTKRQRNGSACSVCSGATVSMSRLWTSIETTARALSVSDQTAQLKSREALLATLQKRLDGRIPPELKRRIIEALVKTGKHTAVIRVLASIRNRSSPGDSRELLRQIRCLRDSGVRLVSTNQNFDSAADPNCLNRWLTVPRATL